MTEIKAADVKSLRDKTGLGIMECKAALKETGGNLDEAVEYLKINSNLKAEKKASRTAVEGLLLTANNLMVEVLNYQSYLAQGGDWGSAISTWLGFDHSKNCKGIHINMLPARHIDGPKTEEEKNWDKQFNIDYISQSGYFAIQSTKPQTLSYAMMESPVGVAAWIVEKFYHWSDLKDGSLDLTYQKDDLLTNIMIYILTKSFNTSSWIYYGRVKEGGRILSKEGRRVEVPTGCAVYPKEFLTWPPKSYVERLFNLVHWTEMEKGGHFAALEQPSSLIKDIQDFYKKVAI